MPSEPYLGQIMPFAGSVIPRGWALCNGALLAITANEALFSLIGTYFGGDGVRTFALPDLRGRAILGASSTIPLGEVGGTVTATLNVAELPPHNHPIQASTSDGAGRAASPTAHVFATNTEPGNDPTKIFVTAGSGDTAIAPATNIANDGGGAAHNNMQPYLTISYLIATQGIFPTRS